MMRKCPGAVGEQDNIGWTPLHYAANYGVEEVVKLFLTNDKSSAYKNDKIGMSSFHLASRKRRGWDNGEARHILSRLM